MEKIHLISESKRNIQLWMKRISECSTLMYVVLISTYATVYNCPVCFSWRHCHLMSWSMVHNGDMSSNVFENFTTCGRKAHHHKATETRQHSRDESALHSKGRVDKMMKSRQMDVWGEAVKGEEERTGESMSSSRSTEQRSHCSRVNARCMIFLTIFSRSVCSSNRSLTTSNRACMTTVKHYKSVVHDVTLLFL